MVKMDPISFLRDEEFRMAEYFVMYEKSHLSSWTNLSIWIGMAPNMYSVDTLKSIQSKHFAQQNDRSQHSKESPQSGVHLLKYSWNGFSDRYISSKPRPCTAIKWHAIIKRSRASIECSAANTISESQYSAVCFAALTLKRCNSDIDPKYLPEWLSL